ncbi:MAG: bifunctional demethylmenaquinone methyltransferase/2-methoxy-6-polyprenyl-1,4-benzoquinol methylase UbiE [Alphaproteobacteria bacterium CG11_big_fil_rev_8_21_14_0_20_44_7]|nr:MAG: bifunctional demethylmenaquinone methyltransferase/2-methoxy-6-polyprenyl-1,4-benzoquinol methylase UbiE [Alphaproteobacteria bacterium CG11_big_fil_rev_8_21_14_0_20_44_7]
MTKNFGFKQVDEKTHRASVDGVFSSVANKYDVMNDFMSLGLHRLWKRNMINELAPRKGLKYLDVAGGSGDISFRAWERGADVTLTDINPDMLQVAKNKAVDKGFLERINFAVVNAEKMPFADNSFDIAGIAFGIRNVTYIDKALSEFYRVLKPGGKFVCLEFSHLNNDLLQKIYDAYSFNIIPKLGGAVANDEASYQYLVESIRKFPAAEDFAAMIESAGFAKVKFRKLNHGIVAIHSGWKV